LARGLGFEAAAAAGEAERRAWAETLWRFVFTSLLVHGLFNADPHPGNYIFGEPGAEAGVADRLGSAEAGVIWFLDFGCSREVPAHRMPDLRGAHRAAVAGDDATFLARACSMLDVPAAGEHRRLAHDYLLQCFEPIRARGPYRITHAFCRTLFDGIRENTRKMALGSRKEWAPLPAEWLFFNRLQLGFYSVLARLDVEVDYAAVEGAILAGLTG